MIIVRHSRYCLHFVRRLVSVYVCPRARSLRLLRVCVRRHARSRYLGYRPYTGIVIVLPATLPLCARWNPKLRGTGPISWRFLDAYPSPSPPPTPFSFLHTTSKWPDGDGYPSRHVHCAACRYTAAGRRMHSSVLVGQWWRDSENVRKNYTNALPAPRFWSTARQPPTWLRSFAS